MFRQKIKMYLCISILITPHVFVFVFLLKSFFCHRGNHDEFEENINEISHTIKNPEKIY
jgi:hypothetical protein